MRNGYVTHTPMTTSIRLQQWTKEQLTKLKNRENHTSHDSTLKALLRDHELLQVLQGNLDTPELLTSPNNAVGTTWGPEAYTGMIGCGKTHTTKTHAYTLLSRPYNATVFFIDPLGAYETVADDLNATTLNGTIHGTFNPFAFTTTTGTTPPVTDAITYKAQLLANYITISADCLNTTQGNTTESPTHDEITTVITALVNHIIDPDSGSEGIDTPASVEDRLTLHALRSTAREVHGNDTRLEELFPNMSNESECEQIRRTAAFIVNILEEFKNVPSNDTLPMLKHDTGRLPPIEDAVHVPLDNYGLTSDTDIDALPWVYATSLLTVFELAKKAPGPSVIFMDEAHYLLAADGGQGLLDTVMRIGERFDVSIRPVFQSPEHLLSADQETLREWDRIHFHRCETIPEPVADACHLSTGQQALLQNADPGAAAGQSEQLIYDVVTGTKTVTLLRGNTHQ